MKKSKIFHKVEEHSSNCCARWRLFVNTALPSSNKFRDFSKNAYYQLEYAWCENDPYLFELLARMNDYVDRKLEVTNGNFSELNHGFRNKFVQFAYCW